MNMIEVRNIQDFNDYLDTLLSQTECDDIEFKSAAGGFPDNFWDTYSLSLHKSQISELLRVMCQNHLLVPQGYGRGMRYYLPEGEMNVFRAEVATSETAKVATSDDKVATSETAKVATSEAKVATSEKAKVATSDGKRRLTKQKMNQLLCEVCEEWRSLEEIASITGKDLKYLRNKIIPRMIKEKQLVMMYPGTPNHPKQQYKIKE